MKTKEEFEALYERNVRTMRTCNPSLTMEQAFEMVAWHSAIDSVEASESAEELAEFLQYCKLRFVEAWLKSEKPTLIN